MDRRRLGTVALCVGLMGLAFAAGHATATPPVVHRPVLVTAAQLVAEDSQPTLGPASAPVTVVVYSDFACAFCADLHQTDLPALRARYGDRVRFVIRPFPLAEVHPESVKAAEASLCAHQQGRYDRYATELFVRAPKLDDASLHAAARDSGLDLDAFDECLVDGLQAAAVAANVERGRGRGVRGTPTTFVAGARIEGLKPLTTYERAIDEALATPSLLKVSD
jgi:protein-disulfide isomerase